MRLPIILFGLADVAVRAAPAELPTYSDMQHIFADDRAARAGTSVDRATVGPADEQRRAAAKSLLDAGKLSAADDYERAAFGDGDAYVAAHRTP